VTYKYLDSLKPILSDLKTRSMAALFSFFTLIIVQTSSITVISGKIPTRPG
jgi:hypothetical protein